jgi:hypothetical protein
MQKAERRRFTAENKCRLVEPEGLLTKLLLNTTSLLVKN